MRLLLTACAASALILSFVPAAAADSLTGHAAIQSLPAGIADVEDVDGDGFADALLVTSRGYQLYYGSAEGKLVPSSQRFSIPELALSADFNRDGVRDFIVGSPYACEARGTISALLSAGKRTYSAPSSLVTLPGGTSCPYVADVNSDGVLELAAEDRRASKVVDLLTGRWYPLSRTNGVQAPSVSPTDGTSGPGVVRVSSWTGETLDIPVPTDQPRVQYMNPLPGTEHYSRDGSARPIFLYRQESVFGALNPTTTFWTRQLELGPDGSAVWGKAYMLTTLPGVKKSFADCIWSHQVVQGRYLNYATLCDSSGKPKYALPSGLVSGFDMMILDLKTGKKVQYAHAKESRGMRLLGVNADVLLIEAFDPVQSLKVLRVQAATQKTIKCRKGAVVKTVRAVKPVCPKGWKKI